MFVACNKETKIQAGLWNQRWVEHDHRKKAKLINEPFFPEVNPSGLENYSYETPGEFPLIIGPELYSATAATSSQPTTSLNLQRTPGLGALPGYFRQSNHEVLLLRKKYLP
jgi:hypothetical protein